MSHSCHRRTFLATTVLAASLGSAAAQAQPASYPSQPIRIVVPFPAGATTDALARRIGQKLQEAWKVPVIVDNKPGAGGTIGAQTVVRAPADGHTVLLHTASLLQTPHLMSRTPYNVLKDLQPAARLVRGQLTLVVQPDIPANHLKEFVALAKAQPGKYQFGSYGNGTTPHIQGAAFALQAGIDLTHVPYQGSAPLMNALKGRQITAAMLDVVAATAHKDSLRLLAVTGPERWPSLPQVPTFKELGYAALDTTGWIGMFMPAGTPMAVVQRFSDEVNRILRLPDVAAQIESMGIVPYASSVEEFQRVVQNDYALFEKMIRETGIRLE